MGDNDKRDMVRNNVCQKSSFSCFWWTLGMFLAFFLGEGQDSCFSDQASDISSLCCRTCVLWVLKAQMKCFLIFGLFP